MRRFIPLLLIGAASAWADPFTQELDARRARFFREGARAQAVVPLTGVL